MQFDPANKVVQLCAEGMALEVQGKVTEAQRLFEQAWNTAGNAFEAFTAAHYMARNQADAQQELHWNKVSLHHALLVEDNAIKGHYPSLYLNIGKSYEKLGRNTEAAVHYQLAADHADFLPAGPYGDMIRSGIREGLKRTGKSAQLPNEAEALINNWCERKELRPLSHVLPAYLGNLGTANDIQKLISAFSYLSATRCLNETDQQAVNGLIEKLTK